MPRQISVVVNDDLDRKVRLYMKASRNKLAAVVRDALDAYIKQELRENTGLNGRFEQLATEYLASANVTSLVTHRKPKKKALPIGPPGIHTQSDK